MNRIYQAWLNSNKLTTSEKLAMKKLSKQEVDTYFSNEPMTFGTAGVRGQMGMGTQRMNRFTYTMLACAYARYIIKHHGINKTIVIAHDNRLNSDVFSKLVADVCTSFKIKVLLFEHNQLMPTPIVSYAIRQTKSVGGLIITASHNPKEYNGFKAYNDDGGQILPPAANEIKKYMVRSQDILDISYMRNEKLISFINNRIIKNYMHDAQQALVNKYIINKKKTYPVVVTTHHGTASKLLPLFLKTLKYNVKPVTKQTFVDPNFPNSPIANPEIMASFNLSIKQADVLRGDICIGVDPDADRMAVCIKHNGKWRLMTGNEMGIVYTYYVLKNRKFTKTPYIISSYVSTNLIDRIAREYKAVVYRTGTGFKWMGAKMTEIDSKQTFVVAFEEAIGATNCTINRDKDSFTAAALALEIYDIYRAQGMDLVDLLEKEIYLRYGNWFGKTESFTFNQLNWKPLVISKMNLLKRYHQKKIGDLKIKKVNWNSIGDCLEWHLEGDSWIKFRMSGTEPKFKIYYNLYGNTQDILLKQYNKLNVIFKKLLGV